MKKNKLTKKDIGIIIIVALIIGFVFSGILSYINYSNKNKEEITEPSGKVENLEIGDEVVQNLFYLTRGDLTGSLFVGTDYENIYYRQDRIIIDEMDENFKKILSFVTLNENLIKQEQSKSIINSDDLKNQYNKIFGNLTDYKDETFNYNCPATIEYNKKSNQYEYENACGYSLSSGYVSKLTEAKKYEDRIEIYETVAFYLLDDNTNEVSYFTTSDYSEYLVVLKNEETFTIEDYVDKLDIYKYTFMRDKDTYHFTKVEKQEK